MVAELNTRRCVSEEAKPRRGVDSRQCANKDAGPKEGELQGSHIDWRMKRVPARMLGPEGGGL